jgi:hypothetical protein
MILALFKPPTSVEGAIALAELVPPEEVKGRWGCHRIVIELTCSPLLADTRWPCCHTESGALARRHPKPDSFCMPQGRGLDKLMPARRQLALQSLRVKDSAANPAETTTGHLVVRSACTFPSQEGRTGSNAGLAE